MPNTKPRTIPMAIFMARSRSLTCKLSDGLGGAGGAHGALTNSPGARTEDGEAVRCSALFRRHCYQALKMKKLTAVTIPETPMTPRATLMVGSWLRTPRATTAVIPVSQSTALARGDNGRDALSPPAESRI